MGVNFNGTGTAYMHTSILDPIVAQKVGDSEAHVMSQKAATASFANALKGKASGNDITLDDVSPIPAPVKAKVRSKNLCNIAEKTSAGNSPWTSTHIGTFPTTSGKKYTISADYKQTGADVSKVSLVVRDGSTGLKYVGESNYSTAKIGRISCTFVAPENENSVRVYAYSNMSATVLNTSCIFSNIQLEEGATATPYRPPIADGTTVNIMTGGKNHLPYPYAEQIKAGSSVITKNGITFTINDDGTVLVNGTATANVYLTLWNSRSTAYGSDLYDIILPKAAMLSGCPAGGGTNYRLTASRDDNGNNMVQDHGAGVAMKSEGYDEVYIRIQSGYTANNLLFKPMIEYGATKTEYEPYKGGGFKSTVVGADVELKSASPNMNIAVDEVCANLEVEYNRDPNIVIDKLTQAIISLGGNI